jgi:hypothetical protein
MLKATSVTYLKEGASTIHLRKLFTQLGISEAIKSKAVETDGEMVSELVAEGKVELALLWQILVMDSRSGIPKSVFL